MANSVPLILSSIFFRSLLTCMHLALGTGRIKWDFKNFIITNYNFLGGRIEINFEMRSAMFFFSNLDFVLMKTSHSKIHIMSIHGLLEFIILVVLGLYNAQKLSLNINILIRF